jgi:hypothetical protein
MVEEGKAQLGGAYFQTFIPDPRTQALGEATVALRGYAGALSINPATIGRSGMIQFSTNIGLRDEDPGIIESAWLPNAPVDLGIANPTLDGRQGRWAVGYQYKYFNLGEVEVRDAQNNPQGMIQVYDDSHKLAVAFDATSRLTIGAGLNLIQSRPGLAITSNGIKGTSFSFDLGIVYDRAFEVPYVLLKPSVGWSITDFGSMLSYDEINQKDPLTMMMRGGLSLQAEMKESWLNRPVATVGLHGGLSKIIVATEQEGNRVSPVGPFEALVKTWRPVEVRTNPLSAEVGEFEEVGVLEQLITHRGLELSLLEIFYLRWGAFDEAKFAGDRSYATHGWGVDLYYVALDYSITADDDAPFDGQVFWRITTRIPLEASPDNFWPELLKRIQ